MAEQRRDTDRYAPKEPRIRPGEEWDTEIDEVAERDIVGKEGGFEYEQPPEDAGEPSERGEDEGEEGDLPRPDLRESD